MPQVSKWRLKRSLKRRVEYRPIESEDLKYLWAAYKKGSLPHVGIPDGLEADQFKAEFERIVITTCHAVWTVFGETKSGFRPIAIVFASWSPVRTHLELLGVSRLPWASNRNIIEGIVGFFSGIRKQHSFIGYALPEYKRMFEICAMHGVARRVGTSYVVSPGKACAVFETRPN